MAREPVQRGDAIRRYLLEHIVSHPANIAAIAAQRFGVSRQAIHKHLAKLIGEGLLCAKGSTKGRVYSLVEKTSFNQVYLNSGDLEEDRVWDNDIVHFLGAISDNAARIWQYAFTEMFNNALEHADCSRIVVTGERNGVTTHIMILDNGVGIFKKLQVALGLEDERHAVIELAKGKLTTDPAHHTGEGIFFTSRMMDRFTIHSGGVFFSHHPDGEDWILEKTGSKGTAVVMELDNNTAKTDRAIFDEYVTGEDYGFTKTVVPVRLAQYGRNRLVSRSQAKRLFASLDRFQTVLFDFERVEEIGQAFADQIFRVFAQEHPEMKLIELNTTPQVKQMISRARAAACK